MKITIASMSDTSGGAARAALRLHKSLLGAGLECRMRVADKRSGLTSVDGTNGSVAKGWDLVRPNLAAAFMRLQRTANFNPHSPSVLSSGVVGHLNDATAELVNLHWICDEFMSVGDIDRIRKPLVWTLHDMWAFCGAEHYAPDEASTRWRSGYRPENRPAEEKGLDIDRWVWNRKRRSWTQPIHLVTPSRWLADCVQGSALMSAWPVTIVPNPLDTRQFQPWPQALARDVLGLPPESKFILFGAIGGGGEPRKGWDLFQSALRTAASQVPKLHGLVLGQSEPVDPPTLGLPLHWMGHLHDDVALALIYSAADVVVLPSRQENLPQSGTEAQACGCPVVAFNCTGLPDVVAHEETGYLAVPFDQEDLARGIVWTLEDPQRHSRLRAAARTRALRLWSPEVVVPQYVNVYEAAIESHRKRSPPTRS